MNNMSEIAPLISDLAVILIAAGIITLIFKCLKQPVVLGYIVAGILAGPAVPYIPTVSDPTNIKIWADIGVIFLLFAMGLEFSFKKLMTVGGTAVIASITIVSGMMFLGYTAGNALGFSHLSSIFLGGMLSMSSTAIVFKAFDDMGLRGQKFTGVVFMNLEGFKIGLDTKDRVDIMVVKCKPDMISVMTHMKGFLPGYYMDKSNWMTILLQQRIL